MKKWYVGFIMMILFSGCAELMQIAQQTLDENKPLTQTEVIAGLREALIAGSNRSSAILGATDGYYGDELVKILLPPEADILINNISRIPGGTRLVEDVLLSINRSAEDAVSEAGPIFARSITEMTIADAMGILRGEDNAATQYLKRTTYDQLVELYKPKIRVSLEKKLVGNVSTLSSWETLTGKWNELATSIPGRIAGFTPVNTDLELYLTQKALDGLFLKIADEEKKIRKNPLARTTELLKRVFGSLDK